MAVYEENALLTKVDEAGNKSLIFPITKLDNVDGAEDLLHYDTAQELTEDQQTQARSNIGAAAADHEHPFDTGIVSEGDGKAYTATVEGITALTAGLSFILIPHTVSTATVPTLNVNGLGAKNIRRRVSNSTVTTVAASSANWLASKKPIRMTYDGSFWIAEFTRPNATDIYGTVAIASGGTGGTTAEAALANLGVGALSGLATEDKSSIVAAINELVAKINALTTN